MCSEKAREFRNLHILLNNIMHYIVYKTINLINQKYYIGCHKTKKLDDGYLGSGKILLRAVEKNGKNNFQREILCVCESEEDMYAKEKELVTEDIVNDSKSYNLKIGGESNFYYINKNGLNHKSDQHLKHSKKLVDDPIYRKKWIDKIKKINSMNGKQFKKGDTPFNTGLIFITNIRTKERKCISPNLLNSFIKTGDWIKGNKFQNRKDIIKYTLFIINDGVEYTKTIQEWVDYGFKRQLIYDIRHDNNKNRIYKCRNGISFKYLKCISEKGVILYAENK